VSDNIEITVRGLVPTDDRSRFNSGNPDLDRFFKLYAGQNQFKHHIGVTYIALAGETIAGFATVSTGEMTTETLEKAVAKKLPRYPLPVLRLARLAVDVSFQGAGVGGLLLKFVFRLALELKNSVGCCGVVVDAKDTAIEYYRQLGFIELGTLRGALGDRPEPMSMFLPLKDIEDAIGS